MSTDEERAREASEVRQGVLRLARRLRAEREPGELTPSRFAVLGRLERDGPATASALASAERVAPQTMARIVQHLLDAGLAERTPDQVDRRATLIRITELGQQRVLADRSRHEAWLAQAMDELTDVERELLVLAARLHDRLAESALD